MAEIFWIVFPATGPCSHWYMNQAGWELLEDYRQDTQMNRRSAFYSSIQVVVVPIISNKCMHSGIMITSAWNSGFESSQLQLLGWFNLHMQNTHIFKSLISAKSDPFISQSVFRTNWLHAPCEYNEKQSAVSLPLLLLQKPILPKCLKQVELHWNLLGGLWGRFFLETDDFTRTKDWQKKETNW